MSPWSQEGGIDWKNSADSAGMYTCWIEDRNTGTGCTEIKQSKVVNRVSKRNETLAQQGYQS